ncbi:MAG: type II secretion system minor pseudopilin GspI [Gammaproteobacteria bacterium]|nr:type II secretion system minor pseudopilin GspI [Gammaproteobacteria bacterium]
MMLSNAQRGFTLLEILVALAILATAMGALIKGGSESASTASYLRDKSYAHWVAQNRVVELQLTKKWLSPGTHKGISQMAGEDWFWDIKASKTFDAAVQRIDVEVRRQREHERPLVTLVAFLAKVD